jgi:hypothetical protein
MLPNKRVMIVVARNRGLKLNVAESSGIAARDQICIVHASVVALTNLEIIRDLK